MTIKEQIIRILIENKSKKLSKSKIKSLIDLQRKDKNSFDVSIAELLTEGIVVSTKKKRLSINNSLNLFIGKFVYNPKGYGFCICTDKVKKSEIKEIFIPPSSIKNALNEDRVIVKITKNKLDDKKSEGEVISILSRSLDTVVGTYIDNGTFGFVIPDNQRINKDIYISKEDSMGAESYSKVVAKIIKYPEGNRKPEGKISDILGFKEEKGIELLSILAENEIRTEFPYKVINQVEKISEKITDEELKYRKDLTELNIFTIDGEDAKDLDDAVSIKKLINGNYELGVHIADVSHYIKENSSLDKEALQRGTSVYLINKVIPMLPKKLSNNLCSLNPDTIKLTLSVFMEINHNGKVVKSNIYESFIKSKARLTYTEVSDFIEGKSNIFSKKYPFIVDDIKDMANLRDILKRKRVNRGAIEFNFAESKIILNENDEPIELKKEDRRIANEIIEEFMLIANETVSEKFFNLGVPFVYRVHEKPREEKIEDFIRFIERYGYEVNFDVYNITSSNLNELIKEANSKPEAQAINLLLLQSMQQARYNPVAKGHFGLGCKYYSHFTSPIRRYPDLQIHRIIKEHLNGGINNDRKSSLSKIVENSSKISSKRERQAQNAENEYDNIKKIEYMSNKIGEEFEGMITGFTNVGLYITLDNTVEGFMRIDRIPDDEYELFRDDYIYRGKNTGKEIMLGNKIKVSVHSVSIENNDIVFDFVEFI